VIAGLAFAIAWSPCIGPTLASILTLAAVEDTPGEGAFLLGVYSLGLGIPFLLTALAFSRMTTAFAVVKRHYTTVIAVGGVIMIGMGVLFVTGEFFRLNIEAQKLTTDLGLNL
jgi:cytochrome c-type biogenesis protein